MYPSESVYCTVSKRLRDDVYRKTRLAVLYLVPAIVWSTYLAVSPYIFQGAYSAGAMRPC